jgi:hypothetical protein
MFYEKIANVPFIGGSQMRKNVERLKKINVRAWDLGKMFEHFTYNSWIYETNKIYKLMEIMNEEEREVF